MKKIKIAFCISGLSGGVTNVILNYFDYISKDDYEVDIISQGEAIKLYIDRYESRGFHVYMVPSKSESFIGNIKSLYRIMHNNSYDIVHAHMTLTNFFPLFVALICGCKIRISHSHLALPYTVKSRILAFLSRIVATDYFACGIDAGKFLFGNSPFIEVKNAIDLNEYKYDEVVRNEERIKFGISKEEKLIGHIGRFVTQKNHIFLIELFECIHKRAPYTRLILIGEGELENEIKKIVKEKGLIDSVIFCGAINDVSRKLQAMDLFLLPSLSEGLPLAAVEAQASGLGCVLSDNISKETRNSQNVKFLSLESEPGKWADICIEMMNVERKDNTLQLIKAGYDISVEAGKLDKFYKMKVNR